MTRKLSGAGFSGATPGVLARSSTRLGEAMGQVSLPVRAALPPPSSVDADWVSDEVPVPGASLALPPEPAMGSVSSSPVSAHFRVTPSKYPFSPFAGLLNEARRAGTSSRATLWTRVSGLFTTNITSPVFQLTTTPEWPRLARAPA